MKNPVLTFIATFVCAFMFLYGAVTLGMTYSPIIALIFTPHTPRIVQLPLSPDRAQPFATREVVLRLYPKTPIDPPVKPEEVKQGWIRIPAINVNVPLIQSASLADEDVLSVLNQGAALYPNGVTPGALGNVFLSAHSTGEPWKGAYRFAFIRINELKTGDVILLDWHGARYTYKIYKSEIVTPTAGYTIPSDHLYPTMSLMACWPLWSTSQRMLVHADLTSITQLTTPKK